MTDYHVARMGHREDEVRARQRRDNARQRHDSAADTLRGVIRDAVEAVYRRFDGLKKVDSLELAAARAADRAEAKSCPFYELQATLIEAYVRQRRLGRRRARGAFGGFFGADPIPARKDVISWLSDREMLSKIRAEEFLGRNGPFEVEALLCCWPHILQKLTVARYHDLFGE